MWGLLVMPPIWERVGDESQVTDSCSGVKVMTDQDFEALMAQAKAAARRIRFPAPPPPEDEDYTHRSQHAEFGAAAH